MSYSKGLEIRGIIKQALKEDIGKKDITTESLIPKEKLAKAVLLAKENLVVCGLDIARFAFTLLDKNVKFASKFGEGQYVRESEVIALIEGKAAPILTAERTALNFLSFLSGVATKTREYVNAVKPYKAKIVDTRKTIPGLRQLQKYAVRIGGGYNHRMKLDEMVLIKDNHIQVTRSQGHKVTSIENTVKDIRRKIPKGMKVEIEVENLKQFKEALKEKPDIIMLDNMRIDDIRKAVLIKRDTQYACLSMPRRQAGGRQAIPHILLEASGGITLRNIRKFAATGVDMISIGALTRSVNSVDISLEFL